MKSFPELLEQAFSDANLPVESIPAIDLYMDQILTLVEDGLSANKRRPQDKLLTKSMIHNYSKEQLIMPVKGKKYSREQVFQLLCVLNLKQTLSMSDIRTLTAHETDFSGFACAYGASLALKENLRGQLEQVLLETFGSEPDLSDREQLLTLCLALSSASTLLRRLCEKMIDEA